MKTKRDEEKEIMRMDIFVAKAECKWHAGEERLPHILDRIPQERVNRILESAGSYPALNRQLMKNIDRIIIEPREIALDRTRITKAKTPSGEENDVFEGELFFVIKIPSSFRIDPQELLENMNVLFSVNCRHSSTKLTIIKYLGTNTM